MKSNETSEVKTPIFTGVIAAVTLLALLMVASLHLEKTWDAIAGAAVCAFGLAAFFFSLRHNPSQMKVRPAVIVTALVLGAAAVVANWLLIRGH